MDYLNPVPGYNENKPKSLSEALSSKSYIPETIKVNGTDRPTRNSRGELIHPSVMGIKNFWKWFGDSKVVDEKGRPHIMFHGANKKFNQFNINKIGDSSKNNGFLGKGFYFSSNIEIAKAYGEVVPCYLSVKNPFDLTKPLSESEAEELNNASGTYAFEKGSTPDQVYNGLSYSVPEDPQISEDLTNGLKDLGYDGIELKGINKDETVVFNPSQIKSATENNGGFNPEAPSIVKESQPEYHTEEPEKPTTLHDMVLTTAGKRYREGIKEKRTLKQTLQGFREYVQEKDMPIKRWQDAMIKMGAKIKDNANPFRDKKLAPGRLQTLSDKFEKDKMAPVIKTVSKIVKTGISPEWIEPYLIARHTPERNADIRRQKLEDFKDRKFNLTGWIDRNNPTDEEIEEKIKQLRKEGNYPTEKEISDMEESLRNADFAGILPLNENDNGSIINPDFKDNPDGFAKAITDDFEKRVDPELINELWKNVKTATDAILDAQVASRMITQKQAAGYRSRYKYYIPLRGWRDDAAKYYSYTKGKAGQGGSVKYAGRAVNHWPNRRFPISTSWGSRPFPNRSKTRLKNPSLTWWPTITIRSSGKCTRSNRRIL